MIWLLFFASAVGYRKGGMIGVDIVTSMLSDKIKKKLDVIIFVIIAFFGCFMFWQGYELASRAKMQMSAAINISMTYVYMVIPFTGFLFVIFSIELIVKRVTGYKG